MRKLMTMIAAVGMAFGLFADPTQYLSVGFEDADFPGGVLTGWTCAQSDATLTQTAGEAYDYGQSHTPGSWGTDASYLKMKTTFGNPVEKAVPVTSVDDEKGLFIDQLVKFTVADEDPNMDLYTDAKILLYVKENEDGTKTNLCVMAGQLTESDVQPHVYDLGSFDDADAWHRVTIKAVGNAYKTGYNAPAFLVYIDEILLPFASDDSNGFASAKIAGKWSQMQTGRYLLPSLNQTASASIASIGYDGDGCINNAVVTDDDTAFQFAKNVSTGITWDNTVKSISYTIGGDEGTIDVTEGTGGTAWIPYATAFSLTVTYTTGFGAAQWVATGTMDPLTTPAQNQVTVAFTGVPSTDASVNINGQDITERVTVTIGGEDYACASFAKALAKIAEVGGDAVLKLKEDLTGANGIGVNDLGVSEAVINSDSAVTLDLGGKTIALKTAAELGEDQQLVKANCASFTITDSVGDGKIDGTVKILKHDGTCNFIVSGDNDFFFEDTVTIVAGVDATISAGSFKSNNDQAFYLNDYLAKPGYKAGYANGYWTVSPIEQATVLTVTADSDKVEVDVKVNDKFYVGDTITVTATPKTGYENAVVTINDGGNGYVVKDEDVAGGIAIVVTVNAKVWDITYMDDETELTALAGTYTIENRDQVTLAEGPEKKGYDFDAWYWDDGFQTKAAAADFATKTENQVLYAKYVAKTYTITVTGGEADWTSYTIENVTGDVLPVTLTAEDKSEEGLVFKNWTVTTPDEGFEIDDENAVETTLTINEGTLANFVIVANFESAQTDPIPVPGPDETVADALKNAGVPEGNPVLETVTEISELTRLNGIITAADGFSSDADVKAAQLANLNDTYLLADITDGALLEAPAVIKVEKIESTTTAGTYAFEVTVKSNGESILAEDCAEALAGKVFVSNALTGETDPFAPVEAKNIANVTIANGKATFEVSYGDGAQGFLKIKAVKPVINSQD